MQESISTIQLLCFAIAVLLCVWSTRLIYLISLHGGREALAMPCRGLASMIVFIAVWGMSIGWNMNTDLTAQIHDREHTIQQLTVERMPSEYAQSIAFVDDETDADRYVGAGAAQTITVSIPDGTVVSWDSDATGFVRGGNSSDGTGNCRIQSGVRQPEIRDGRPAPMQSQQWLNRNNF